MAETKTISKRDHPTYEHMISGAIASLKERNGSSRPAIKKYILANYGLSAGAHFDAQISLAIRRGVEKGAFVLPKGITGSIKLVKPEKKTSTAPVKKTTTIKKDTAAKNSKKVPVKKATAPVKKTATIKKTTPVKKAAPTKKITKSTPVQKIETPVKKIRKAPTERVNKPKLVV